MNLASSGELDLGMQDPAQGKGGFVRAPQL
jgi:hypothetical protein